MTLSPLEVRPAGLADLATLVEFNASMALETEAKHLDPRVLEAGILAVLRDPAKGRYVVAARDGRILGALLVTYEWSDWRNRVFWWIQSVYVRADARSSGVFKALYHGLEAEAKRSSDVAGLRLYVDRDNVRAQQVYAALGMQRSHYELFEVDFVLGERSSDPATPA